MLERPRPGVDPPLYRCGTAHRGHAVGDDTLTPPMTFPPCPSPTPLIRWSLPRMYHRNGRQMTTHTGSAIQDLLLRPDSGMSQCASYDSATTMSQMSQAPDIKKHFSDRNGVTFQLRTGHARARLQLRNATTLASRMWHPTLCPCLTGGRRRGAAFTPLGRVANLGPRSNTIVRAG